jgi:hypothetical protein
VDTTELSAKLSDYIKKQSSTYMPSPVLIEIFEARDLAQTGYAFGTLYGSNVRVYIPHSWNLTKAIGSIKHVVWALPIGSADASEFIAIGYAYNADGAGRFPGMIINATDEFIHLSGSSSTDTSQPLVDAADLSTPGSIAGWFKIYVQDNQSTNPIADGVYYVPFYTAPTA